MEFFQQVFNSKGPQICQLLKANTQEFVRKNAKNKLFDDALPKFLDLAVIHYSSQEAAETISALYDISAAFAKNLDDQSREIFDLKIK